MYITNTFGIYFNPTDYLDFFYRETTNKINLLNSLSSTACSDGVWRHVTFVYDGIANKYFVNINGVLANTLLNARDLQNVLGVLVGLAKV